MTKQLITHWLLIDHSLMSLIIDLLRLVYMMENWKGLKEAKFDYSGKETKVFREEFFRNSANCCVIEVPSIQ